jgi:hypothetical protein
VGRLRLWDAETGAKEGHLDHALRKSSRLRDGVLELLHDLRDLSAQGKSFVPREKLSTQRSSSCFHTVRR